MSQIIYSKHIINTNINHVIQEKNKMNKKFFAVFTILISLFIGLNFISCKKDKSAEQQTMMEEEEPEMYDEEEMEDEELE
jgi:hypothetical protein